MNEFEKEVPKELIDEILFLFYMIHKDLSYGFLEKSVKTLYISRLLTRELNVKWKNPLKYITMAV